MAKVPEPAVTTDEIVFELERFQRTDGWLTLTGRWFGVRGRRFVRPTLTLVLDGERTRALADLEDKPWAAEDGEPWRASFPWPRSGQVDESELSVAPDITIELPAPGARRGRAQRLAAQNRRDAMTASWGSFGAAAEPAALEVEPAEPAETEIAVPESQLTAPDTQPDAPLPEPEVPRQDPEALQAELEALRVELTRASATAAQAEAELESLRQELSAVRDQLQESQRQLEAREAELLAAQTDLAAGRAARDAALRNAARAEADREAALSRCEDAEAERDAVAGERAELAGALEERRSAVEHLTRQHEQDVTARGAALVMRGATQALPAYERHVGWLRRVLAVLVPLGIVFAVLIVLGVL